MAVDEPVRPADTSDAPDLGPTRPQPVPISPAVRNRFRRQRPRNTVPELALRRLLHARGLRYRVDVAPLPGLRRRADVVFTRARLAVFVDGCFWHRCPEHFHPPKANAEWWALKLRDVRRRDRDTDFRLRVAGWLPLRFWEHVDPATAARRIAREVARRTP